MLQSKESIFMRLVNSLAITFTYSYMSHFAFHGFHSFSPAIHINAFHPKLSPVKKTHACPHRKNIYSIINSIHQQKYVCTNIKRYGQLDDINEKFDPISYSQIIEKDKNFNRRSFLSSSLSALSSTLIWYGNGMEYSDLNVGIEKYVIHPQSAYALGKPGLVQFPCKNGLANTYYMMRAGQSLLEADDIWTTNPLFL